VIPGVNHFIFREFLFLVVILFSPMYFVKSLLGLMSLACELLILPTPLLAERVME